MWPSGEEAADIRHAALLRAVLNVGNVGNYIARKAAGDKRAQQPKILSLDDCKALNRGTKPQQQGLLGKSAAEINQTMRNWSAAMGATVK